MKHFKIGIAALVAVLAMSFTIASHEGAFKKSASNSKFAFTCSSTNINTFFWCSNGVATQVTGSTLAGSVPPVKTCTFTTTSPSPSDGFTCNQTPNFFCCMEQGASCTPTCNTPKPVISQIAKLHFSSRTH